MSMWFWEFESCYEPEISDLFFFGKTKSVGVTQLATLLNDSQMVE